MIALVIRLSYAICYLPLSGILFLFRYKGPRHHGLEEEFCLLLHRPVFPEASSHSSIRSAMSLFSYLVQLLAGPEIQTKHLLPQLSALAPFFF